MLCGNKVDLEAEKREVTKEQGKEFARKISAPFFETSGNIQYTIHRGKLSY